MPIKGTTHIIRGMQRDAGRSKLGAEFAYEAHNIRITSREHDTLLDISNEKGNKDTEVTFEGTVVGYCVLDRYLVVFSAGEEDIICRIDLQEGYERKELFRGDLDLDTGHPLETIGIYENENIQKVYWLDGKNQPRVINIVEDTSNYTSSSFFDFVNELKLQETVKVTRIAGGGMFSSGTVQYAFSYYNKYMQETNIFYTTELNYVSFNDRGGSPEDSISNSFRIEIEGLDDFEYLRIYSIHRTSIDAVPVVKNVTDIYIKGFSSVTYVDSNTTGSDVDPTQLLYIGGESIVAQTMTHKDNTLFLGNLELIRPSVPEEIRTSLQSKATITLSHRQIHLDSTDQFGYYNYSNQLSENTSTFKTGEHYRLGLQFQYKNGKWSEPVVVDKDYTLSESADNRPSIKDDVLTIPKMSVTVPQDILSQMKGLGYRRCRALVVFPTVNDRKIVAQGMVCPTVFSIGNRLNNSPFSQASWFLRPFLPHQANTDSNSDVSKVSKGAWVEFRNLCALKTYNDRGAEIQSNRTTPAFNIVNGYAKSTTKSNDYSDIFYIDQSVLTFHSPEVEFDTAMASMNGMQLKFRLVGLINFTASIGDIDIQTSTPTAKTDSTGFVHKTLGSVSADPDAARSLVAGLFYKDYQIDDDEKGKSVKVNDHQKYEYSFMVYPWHRNGSLNNDFNRPDKIGGTRTAMLDKKRISNLKFSLDNTWLTETWKADRDGDSLHNGITPIQLFDSNEVSLIKLQIPKNTTIRGMNYYGNVDTIVPVTDKYPIVLSVGDGRSSEFNDDVKYITDCSDKRANTGDNNDELQKSRDPVRMKYKSGPHLVFSLNYSSQTGSQIILPSVNSLNRVENTATPFWSDKYVPQDAPSTQLPDKDENGEDIDWETNPVSNWENALVQEETPQLDDVTNHDDAGNTKVVWLHKNVNFPIPDVQCFIPEWAEVHGSYVYHYEIAKYDLQQKMREFTGWRYTGREDYHENEYMNHCFQIWRQKSADAYYVIDMGINPNPTWYPGKDGSSSNEGTLDPGTQDTGTGTKQDNIILGSMPTYPFLFLGELYRDDEDIQNAFGGDSETEMMDNLWLPAGPSVPIDTDTMEYLYGDTWYQRYDCLKTYAFTPEDMNQVVEIGSFMCETRMNIDGRYDRNRGQLSNLNMSRTNFNLLNEVYSQKDNFFTYRIFDRDYYRLNRFPNSVTWSKEKQSASMTDTWTNVTMANVLDMDGDKGEITKLYTFNNNIFCFQPSGISQILFNSRVQIPVNEGVPVEIGNSNKVDGKVYMSSGIGCRNRLSVMEGSSGLYFVSENGGGIYMLSIDGLANLTLEKGFERWIRDNMTQPFRTFYDKVYGDIYFSGKDTCICYSEKLRQFVSFMDYQDVPYMFNYRDRFYSIAGNGGGFSSARLWEQFKGEYNSFFGVKKPYSITVIENAEEPLDKIFNNIEFRADLWKGKECLHETFDTLETWTEYQKSSVSLTWLKDRPSSLKRKFRIWGANIPRDESNHRDRIRGPWAFFRLSRKGEDNYRMELHDLIIRYFV